MIKSLALACALLCALTINAEAGKLHPRCNIDWPCIAPSASTPEQVRWARGMYIQRQIGLGGPHVKRARGNQQKANNRRHKLPISVQKEITRRSTYSRVIGITEVISRPVRFIAGRLKCALNLNAALAEKGIAGTGSAMAHSFDRWGRPSLPVPGAVAVTDRRGGGHVALVSRVEGGRVFVFNPGRRGWAEMEYTHRRARYRVASQ